MPEFFSRAVWWAVVACVLAIIFGVPLAAGLGLGLAWGIIALGVVCAGCVWLAGQLYIHGNLAGMAPPLMLLAVAGLAVGLGIRWVL